MPKILWHGVPSAYKTGYGVQTRLWTKALRDAGHDVVVSSVVPGMTTYTDNQEFLTLSSGCRGAYGNDFIRAHCEHYQPDVVLSCADTFPFDIKKFARLPWVAWQVVDATPLMPQLIEPCKTAKLNLAMTRFGQHTMKAAGFDSQYVPLAFDPSEYYPRDRQDSRTYLSNGWEMPDLDKKFLVVMNAANMSRPSRKNFACAFDAFNQLLERGVDAVLYVHTEATGKIYGGEDLYKTAAMFPRLTPETLIFAEQYNYCIGLTPDEFLPNLYSAADVLLVTSSGEGFCLPVIESQSCGCPVITSSMTGQAELCIDQELICEYGIWTQYVAGSRQFVLDADMIAWLLYDLQCNPRRVDSRKMKPFEIETVCHEMLLPVLNDFINSKKGDEHARVIESQSDS